MYLMHYKGMGSGGREKNNAIPASVVHDSPWVTASRAIKRAPWFSLGTEVSHPAGSVIYTQDSPPLHLYYIVEGRVKVSILSEEGEEKTLAIHEAGTFFGETSFFDGQPSFATATAMHQSRLLIFGKNRVRLLFHSFPEVTDLILESMGRKIRLLTMQVEALSFFHVEKRVAFILNKLIAEISEPVESGGLRLTVGFTDQELGSLVGVRREAVTKVIGNFKKMGILTRKSKIFYFANPDLLHKFIISDLNT